MLTRIALLAALLPALVEAEEGGSFVSLDRADRDSFVSVAMAGHFFSGSPSSDMALRENLYARYVSEGGGGVYAQVGFAQASGLSEWNTAMSDLELGAVLAYRADGMDVVWRFGVGLPTATSSPNGTRANIVAFSDRIMDYPLIVPYTLWLRPGGALHFGSGSFFAQVDAGIDLPITTKQNDYGNGVMVHANGGVGVNEGAIALAAELANDLITGGGSVVLLQSVGGSLRWREGAVQPFIAYGVAFGGGDFPTTHSLTGGVQGRL
jgi:hypothetical protein